MKLFCAPSGDRDGSAQVRRLLKYAFGQTYGLPMPEIALHASGKPFFSSLPDVHFSLSHTKGGVACIIGGAPCGVDIEPLSRVVSDRVIHRICTPGEAEEFDFLELWTLKESFFKLFGEAPPKISGIVFSRRNGEIVPPVPGVNAQAYYQIPGFVVSACSPAPLPENPYYVGLEELNNFT